MLIEAEITKWSPSVNDTIFDKIIIGAGVGGLAAAYEILSATKKAGKSIKLIILTDKINAPTLAGTNIVLGIDGFEEGELPPNATAINDLVRGGLERINQVVREEKINCRHDLYFQLVAPTKTENTQTKDFLVDRFQYKPEEFSEVENPGDRLHFSGLDEATECNIIGQLNGPEFVEGLANAIRRMGGCIVENTMYASHFKRATLFEIQTTNGIYLTSSPPLLAGGPHLMSKVAGMPVKVSPKYTMAMHVELSANDAKNISVRPLAFFNIKFDYLWGSLDSKNILTIGQGNTNDTDDRRKFESKLRLSFDQLLPKLKGLYEGKMSFSFNAMAWTENMLPVVGRLADFDVVTGNCGRGFVLSFAEAIAYADHFINGNDHKLQLFESLNFRRPNDRF
jgi:glycine/D-amino acid oxidase-like deaminating enzyme